MNATATAPAVLSTAAEARRRVAAIRNALAVADDLLAQAYAARDWEALGHASWAAYCAAELPELRMIKLRTGPRRERVAALVAAGASLRDVQAATGSSLGTAHNDVAALSPATVAEAAPPGTAGAVSASAPGAPPAAESRADQVVRLVYEAGTRGRTTAEIVRATGLHHGIVSGALSRVARQGRVRVTATARAGYGVYVGGDQ